MFLVGGGGAIDLFVMIGGTTSVEGRGVGMFDSLFKDEGDS